MASRKTLDTVIIEREENVATIIMNQPEKRNIFTPEMRRDLVSAFEEVRDDDSVSVVITTGAGDVAWSGGMSGQSLVAGYESGQRGERSEWGGYSVSDIELVRTFPKVTIAAVNGYCLGRALMFMNVHDLAIASEERARFGLPEVMRGFPPGPVPASTVRVIPPKWAFDLVLTGDNWDARTAQKVGLISRVVPHAQLREAALQWAKEIARWDRVTMEYIKKQFRAAMDEPNYTKAEEWCMLYMQEHHRVNPKAMRGMRDFLGKTGRAATSMIKWGFKD